MQVTVLQQQLNKGKSRFGRSNVQSNLQSKAVPGTVAAAVDEFGHLHTQVEGVESTIATLRLPT